MSILDWNEVPLPNSWEKYESYILIVYAFFCLGAVTVFYAIASKATAELAACHMGATIIGEFNSQLLSLEKSELEHDLNCYINCTYDNGTKMDMYDTFINVIEFNNWKRDKFSVHINYNESQLQEYNESGQWFWELEQ